MAYWWVNQGQSYKEELNGNYVWSPKKEQGGRTSTGYTNMTYIRPDDVIFSYAKGKIQAIGTATSSASEATDPHTTKNRETLGWKVTVHWNQLVQPTPTRDFIAENNYLLPKTYSPVLPNGKGKQKIYLAEIQFPFAQALFKLCKTTPISSPDYDPPTENNSTEIEQTILARRKQHVFRSNLLKLEQQCPITHVSDTDVLIASHIKPWAKTKNDTERLDPYNGFLFAPHIDKLFDNGHISFADNGDLLIATERIKRVLEHWHIPLATNIGAIHPNRKKYLAYHRRKIFQPE